MAKNNDTNTTLFWIGLVILVLAGMGKISIPGCTMTTPAPVIIQQPIYQPPVLLDDLPEDDDDAPPDDGGDDVPPEDDECLGMGFAVTHGFAGSTDWLEECYSLDEITSVHDAVFAYMHNTDWLLADMGCGIDWQPSGNEPAPGTTYFVEVCI